MTLSAILLSSYGNIEDICSLIQRANYKRFLWNELNTSVIPEEKRLQIID
jgi:hypothetical protein